MISTTAPEQIERFLKDASNLTGGRAEAVYEPETELEVSEMLARASAEGTPTTVSAGRTGLAGGAVPMEGVVLSLARMNTECRVDVSARTVAVDPGVVLADLQQEVESMDLLYPPDPTERTCL